MIKDVLGDLGFAVVGPVPDMTRALVVAKEDHLSGAVLDINVGGEPIYPVAAALALRDIPFVFITGYSADSIDSQYAHVPTLEKPIEPEMLRRLFVEGRAEHGRAADWKMRNTAATAAGE